MATRVGFHYSVRKGGVGRTLMIPLHWHFGRVAGRTGAQESAAMPAGIEKTLTEAEYLEREETNRFRSEFYRGEMFAMVGGSP